jgi:hypothetical protein
VTSAAPTPMNTAASVEGTDRSNADTTSCVVQHDDEHEQGEPEDRPGDEPGRLTGPAEELRCPVRAHLLHRIGSTRRQRRHD